MSNRFKKGSGVYQCGCCGHMTRDTGGDGSEVGLCDLCFSLQSEQNVVFDSGETDASASNVKAMLAALDKRSGKACAADLFPALANAVGYAT